MSGEQTELNALDMSDEDFLNTDPAAFDQDVPVTEDAAEETDDHEDTADESEDETESASDESDQDEEDKDEGEDDEEADADDSEESGDSGGDDADTKPADSPSKNQPPDSLTEAQFAAIGQQIMGEFKANGRTMKVKSADDAIQLMQMGANYHQKMAGLKPSLKTLKLLENHDLLDPTKLNFLIDLSQKKPEAITKLLKDSNIDPMDLNLEEESDYAPANRTVSDKALLLDEVLASIETTPTYTRTLNVLGEDWDEKSRQTIAENPQIIATINAHMGSGVFDQVADAVAYERSMGKLQGVSDFDAYQTMGDHMHKNNLFRATASPSDSGRNPETRQSQGAPVDSTKDVQRKSKKQAASPSRQKKTVAKGDKDNNFNPLAMSDEEYLKQFG